MTVMLRTWLVLSVLSATFSHAQAVDPRKDPGLQRLIERRAAEDAAAAVHYRKIHDQIQVSDYDSEAMASAAQAIAELQTKFPNNGYTKLAMAEFLYSQVAMSNGQAGLEQVQSLAVEAGDTADSYILQTKVAVLRGKPKWALAHAKKALKLAPDKPEAHFAMGLAEKARYRPADAAFWFTRAAQGTEDARRKSSVYYWLADALVDEDLSQAERNKHRARAREAYRFHAALHPHPTRLFNYGRFLVLHDGDFTEGEKALRTSLALAPCFDCPRRVLAIVEYARWATDYLAGKTTSTAQALAQRTGESVHQTFVWTAQYPALNAVAKALLKSKDITDVDVISGPCDCTALIKAAHGGNFELVQALVAAGANVNAQDSRRVTPLMFAVMREDADMASFLLSKGARPNTFDATNMTPLEHAIGIGDAALPAFKVLLQHNADARAPDRNGQPLTFYAARSKNMEALRILIEQHGHDPNARGRSGIPLLGWAAFAGMEDGVKYLLEKGASPWVYYDGNEGIVDRLNSTMGHFQEDPEWVETLTRVRNVIAGAQKKTPRQ